MNNRRFFCCENKWFWKCCIYIQLNKSPFFSLCYAKHLCSFTNQYLIHKQTKALSSIGRFFLFVGIYCPYIFENQTLYSFSLIPSIIHLMRLYDICNIYFLYFVLHIYIKKADKMKNHVMGGHMVF